MSITAYYSIHTQFFDGEDLLELGSDQDFYQGAALATERLKT